MIVHWCLLKTVDNFERIIYIGLIIGYFKVEPLVMRTQLIYIRREYQLITPLTYLQKSLVSASGGENWTYWHPKKSKFLHFSAILEENTEKTLV